MKFGFIYLTTNKVNNKKYIGQRHIHTNDPKSDQLYMGSGINISRAIRKYGKENFFKIILQECDTQDQLNAAQKKWIEFYGALNNPEFYNIAAGGYAGDTWTGRSEQQKQEFRNIISQSNKRRKRDSSKISGNRNPCYGKRWFKDQKNGKQYYLYPDDPLIVQLNLVHGMYRSKEHNLKISQALKGKKKS